MTFEEREAMKQMLLRLREDNKQRALMNRDGRVPWLGVDDYLLEIACSLGISIRDDGLFPAHLVEQYPLIVH